MTNENRKFALLQENAKPVEVKELSPEEFWSGSISVEGLSDEEFAGKIREAAVELGFTYSGYRTEKKEGGFTYYFSRYPRKAFGPVAPIKKHQEALLKLAGKFNAEPVEDQKVKESKFRVLFGLREGYKEYKKKTIVDKINNGEITTLGEAKQTIQEQIGNIGEFNIKLNEIESLKQLKNILEKIDFGKEHTIEEVKTELGEHFDLTEAEIYSVGPWGYYSEPAVIIEGDKSQLREVYSIAEKYHQSRIAVEDLQKGTSQMVETKYCEDPNKE